MVAYTAPIRDMQFVISEQIGLDRIAKLPAFKEHDISAELLDAVLDEANKLAVEILAPLNRSGDQQGVRRQDDGKVRTAAGFSEAYQQFITGGWNGLSCPTEFEGQGLPELVNIATQEMWNSANLSFALCPLLTAGAVEAIRQHGSETQQALYLPKMISGEWTGTMNLTEPQAGSDLSAIRTKALPEGDHYRISGQKIYITWGEHDMAKNIIHLVLARTPDAPEGVKGISLFIVPKFIPDEKGNPGQRNDLGCTALEHKLGIHASPTCVMSYGDNEGAIGYLVGEKNMGLAYMFTMMNEARLRVGLQGVAIAERAYQQAREFAKTRIQGRPPGVKHGDRVSIIHHPDVRRMLLTMKAQTEAMRILCYDLAQRMDLARHHPNKDTRNTQQARIDLLIPVVKGWCTEVSQEIVSLGVQIHGGMGFVEETGAAQHLRDARILPVYEGTTGIQANDLLGRKLTQDDGRAMQALLTEMQQLEQRLATTDDERLRVFYTPLQNAVRSLTDATNWMLKGFTQEPDATFVQAVNYLMLTGYVCGGYHLAQAALLAQEKLASGDNSGFYQSKFITARFYAEHILPRSSGLLETIQSGGESALALTEEQF